jgi:F-type H+-transporting ATPase subunit gamma
MTAFANKEFDAIEIIYSEFKNAATQLPTAEALLPNPTLAKKAKKKKRRPMILKLKSVLLKKNLKIKKK